MRRLFVAKYSGAGNTKAENFFRLGLEEADYLNKNNFNVSFIDDGVMCENLEKKLKILIAYDTSPEKYTELHEIMGSGNDKEIESHTKSLKEIYSQCSFSVME